jgi:3-phosphoshikimate 1-carboxyvinyltransferase
MVIAGPVELQGARVGSRGDHRIAMMLGVAGLAACGETIVEGWEWTQISYPGFGEALSRLRKASP